MSAVSSRILRPRTSESRGSRRGRPFEAHRTPIAPILAVNFVGALGFSIVLPFLIFLVTRWGGNALIYGIVGATYSVFQLIGAPILGRWSDVHGRRKILLLSQLGTLASWGILALAFALPETVLLRTESGMLGTFALTIPLAVLFVARALDGLTGGNVSVANAYLADISSEDDRSANFGKMAVAANVGFVLGPAIAGVMGGTPLGELLPVLAALSISVVASGLIAFGLPESRPCVMEEQPEGVNVHTVLGPDRKPCVEVASEKPSLATLLRLPGLAPLLAVHFLVMLAFNFFYVAFPVYAASGLSWSVRETGVFFSILSISMALVQGPLLGRVSKRWSDSVLTRVGGVILAASFPLFGMRDYAPIYLGVALLALGNGLMWPSLMSMISKAVDSRYQGAVQGVASSGGAIASILGLVVGGFLYGSLEGRVFLLSASILAVAWAITLGTRNSAASAGAS